MVRNESAHCAALVLVLHYSGDSNYSSAGGTVTLTVTPAPLTVSANNATREYGAPNPNFPGTLTGVVPGDTVLVTYSTAATILSPVGNIVANLAAAGSTDVSNYTITNTPGTLTTTQTPLTITVADASRQYGQPNPQFTSTTQVTLDGISKAGTLNGDAIDISYSTPATTTSSIGTYPINATVSGAHAGNYLVTVVPGTLR